MRVTHSLSASIVFILCLLLLSGCSTADPLTIDCHVFEDNVDQVAEIAVGVGEEFTVTLCTLSNRGYHWSEEVDINNQQVVEVLSHEYEPGRSPMGGIPGKEVWIFRGLEPGTATISLEHTQPSGRNSAGIWTYHLKVTVNPSAE